MPNYASIKCVAQYFTKRLTLTGWLKKDVLFDRMMNEERKPIKLRYGKIKALAKIFGCSRMTVARALQWRFDTDLANEIRERAKTLGFVRNF